LSSRLTDCLAGSDWSFSPAATGVAAVAAADDDGATLHDVCSGCSLTHSAGKVKKRG